MPNYKPHAPAIVGCEWPGARQRVLPIGPGNAAGPRILAASSQSVDSITTLTRTPAGPQPLIFADVYDLANDVNPPDELCVAKPTACYSISTGWNVWIAGVQSAASDPAVTNAVDDILGDNQPTSTGANDSLVTQTVPFSGGAMFFNNGTFFHGTDGSSGASISGKRIKYIEVIAVMSNQSPTPITVCGCLQGSGSVGAFLGIENSAPQVIPPGTFYQRMRFRFLQNNAVGGLPWDHGNLAPYFAGQAGFGFRVLSKPGPGWFVISLIEFGVHVCTEPRVATGYGFGLPGKDVFTNIPMRDPLDGSVQSWAKQSGHEYLVAFTAARAPSAIFGVSVGGVAGAPFVDLPTTHLASLGLGQVGMGVPTTDPIDDIDAMHCLLNVGAGYSADSNAYASVATILVGADGAASARQDLTGSGNFGTVGLVVAGDGTQNKPLTIQLKRGSSVLATATISPQDSDVPADGRPTVVKRALDNAVTFSGGEYLQVSSTSAHGWSLPRMSTRTPTIPASDGSAVAAATAGVGGNADSGDSDVTQDFPWWAATIPNPPTGLTAASANYTTTNASPGGPKRISYAALNWTTTALGGNFDHYEVLRNNNVIAAITDESKSYFNDFEARRGEVASYAVRVVRTDGAVSHVSAAATATITSPGDCDEILTCNADPTLTCAYQSAAPHGYGRSSSDGITPVAIAGRQGMFVVRPLLEGNVDEFSRVYTVQINDFDVVPAVFDRAPFDPIVAIIEAPLPYVAVCEGNGRRWFAAGKIGQGSMVFDQPGNAHRATVAWTEVATLPAIVQTDDPWQP